MLSRLGLILFLCLGGLQLVWAQQDETQMFANDLLGGQWKYSIKVPIKGSSTDSRGKVMPAVEDKGPYKWETFSRGTSKVRIERFTEVKSINEIIESDVGTNSAYFARSNFNGGIRTFTKCSATFEKGFWSTSPKSRNRECLTVTPKLCMLIDDQFKDVPFDQVESKANDCGKLSSAIVQVRKELADPTHTHLRDKDLGVLNAEAADAFPKTEEGETKELAAFTEANYAGTKNMRGLTEIIKACKGIESLIDKKFLREWLKGEAVREAKMQKGAK